MSEIVKEGSWLKCSGVRRSPPGYRVVVKRKKLVIGSLGVGGIKYTSTSDGKICKRLVHDKRQRVLVLGPM